MAKKPTKTETSRQTYRVLSPVRSDGDLYQPGEQIDLTDDQAVELADLGAIDPKPVEPPAGTIPAS